MMPKSINRFVWYELMTTDTAGAEAFYSGVAGWDVRKVGVPGVDYTLFNAGDTGVAGAMTIPQAAAEAGARPGWIGYLAVADVDAEAVRIEQANGRIHRAPDDIPGVGRFAVAADPQGATFALFQPAGGNAPPSPSPGTPGHVGWNELMAAEWETAFAFYADLYGWAKAEAVDMGPMGTYQTFGASGDNAFGGMMTKPEEIPAPYWRYYFNVEGIDAAKRRVEEGGGQITMGPMEVPGGAWVVTGLDPQGAEFALVAPTR
jgi:hypothetical protein